MAPSELPAGPYAGPAWRVVEAQHLVSTRKLVDSAAEQALLEDLIDRVKPPVPADVAALDLHYLLSTPFRHPPLRHGSRFGTRSERGIWYGAEELPTALAEVAYYRLLFLEGSAASLGPLTTELTAFRADLRTARGVDLLHSPQGESVAAISSPTDYRAAQALGRALRAAGAALVRYRSARDPAQGPCLAVLDPATFAARRPRSFETWISVTTRDVVELTRKDFLRRAVRRFPRHLFEIDGQLPAPAP